MNKVKAKLKNNYYISTCYVRLFKLLVKLLVLISPTLATRFLYRNVFGEKINLKNPQNFNEKIQWLKLFWSNPLVIQCADKYAVREYVENCGCSEILNELYGVYRNTNEINWDSLPEKFVLKTTNSCGTNIICLDINLINKAEAFDKLNRWLKVDYGLVYAEIHYSKIVPRIICEKYIESDDGLFPIDYKIFCFNGIPKYIYVGVDRETNFKRIFFDTNWNPVNLLKNNDNVIIEKPKTLNEMLKYAKKLSKPFPFVRIDLYESKGKTLFGEMTFTPSGGTANYYTEDALMKLGSMIELPKN